MESKNKLKLLGLVAASLLVVACGSNEPKEQNQASTTPAANESSNEASPTAIGSGESIQEETIEEAAITAPTVFYFGFDKSTLSPETREGLDQLAKQLKGKTDTVRIEGNTDERGTREYNLALGERRAQAVANYLAVQGVDPKRFDIISYGEEKPAVYGSNEAAWAKNRRVEVKQ